MKKRDIVVVGIQPWDLPIAGNSKNLAIEFAKENRVLFVNYALDRVTKLKNKNSEQVKNRLDVIKGKTPDLEKKSDNLWVFTPKVQLESINWIKSKKVFRLLNKRNNIKLAREIKSAINRLNFENFVVFNDNDIFRSLYLKESLKPSAYIYYIRDYVIAVDYWKRHGESIESELIAKSDAVTANSTFLAKYAEKNNKNSFYVGQGCDLSMFDPNSIDKLPADVQKSERTKIGYVGALKSLRLDIELLVFIANSRPEWDLVLVGPEDETFRSSKLHKLPNVKFLGSKNPDELPAYIKSFDVCLNPQVVNEVTIGNNPRKIDEYLAMGKPVVATKTEAMSVFKEVTYQPETKEDYLEMISMALDEDDESKANQRILFASNHTWKNNTKEIYDVIEKVEAKQNSPIAKLGLLGNIKSKLEQNQKLKSFIHRLLIPKNQATPRLWVKSLLNPIIHKKGKGAKIRRRVRKDVLPFNKFNLGSNSTIEDFATINNGLGNVIIGDRVRVGLSNTVIGPVKIKNDVIIAQNVVMSGLNHGYEDINLPPHKQVCNTSEIIIEDEVWIGANCVILPGVTIGKHSVVAAGSIVTKSVPPYSVVAGNPAKVIKQYNPGTSSWEKAISANGTKIKENKAA